MLIYYVLRKKCSLKGQLLAKKWTCRHSNCVGLGVKESHVTRLLKPGIARRNPVDSHTQLQNYWIELTTISLRTQRLKIYSINVVADWCNNDNNQCDQVKITSYTWTGRLGFCFERNLCHIECLRMRAFDWLLVAMVTTVSLYLQFTSRTSGLEDVSVSFPWYLLVMDE